MDVLGGVLLWAGLLAVLAGLISLATRRRGWRLLAGGVAMFVAGVYLPIHQIQGTGVTRLDEFAPVFQWGEIHQILVAAPRSSVDAAIRSVTPEEIRYYRTLTWLRRVVGPRGPGVLNPPPGRPILDIFVKAFRQVTDDPGREILMGSTARRGDTLMKIGFNFRIVEVDASHCRVTTETRVYAEGRHMVRGFAAYWRMIYPGSALIRRSWLRAIRIRAESLKSDPMALI